MDRKLKRHFLRFRRHGDAAALAKVFDLTSKELGQVARFLVKDSATAEDIVQATYLTAIEKAASYDDSLAVMPWLMGILAKHAAKARGKALRSPDPERLPDVESEDPHDTAERRELGQLIEGRIRALPETYAPAVHSYLAEGRPPREIGRALGISAGAASVRLHRGLKLLRQSLPAGASMAAAPPMLDLGSVRDQVLSALEGAPGSSSLAATTTTASTLGTLMLKHQILIATSAVIIGVGSYSLLTKDSISDTTQPEEQLVVGAGTTDASSAASPALQDIGYAQENDAGGDESSRRPEVDSSDAALSAEDWLKRLMAAPNHRVARKICEQLAALEGRAGLEILQEIYAHIPEADYRVVAFHTYLMKGHPQALAVLHLGTGDASLEVQTRALKYLGTIAFADFQANFDDYRIWQQRFGEMELAQALEINAREFAVHIASLQGEELLTALRTFEDLDLRYGELAGVDLGAVLREAGILTSLERWFENPDQDAHRTAVRWTRELGAELAMRDVLDRWLDSDDAERRTVGLRWLDSMKLDEAYLRDRIFPIVQHHTQRDSHEVEGAVRLLGQPGNDWAVDALLNVLLNPREGTSRFFGTSMALAEIGDPRVIPTMIAVIAADNTYDSVYGVGHFGLSKLTGVDYDESHDGDFWVEWWANNKSRLPAEVRGMSLPYVDFGH